MSDETLLTFGHPPEKKGSRRSRSPIKGQRRMLEKLLPSAIPKKLSEKVVRRKRLATARHQEAERTDWKEFVFYEGTRDELRRLGRYYELAEDAIPLGLFSLPPRVEGAKKLGIIKGGDNVFVIKDTEKSSDPRRNGWAEVVVLEGKAQEGEKPKIRGFNDIGIKRIILYAFHQGIVDRQVLIAK